jgi:hypothetical protein
MLLSPLPRPVIPAEPAAAAGASDTLELQSFQKAAHALTSVLDLDQLLQQLMMLALQSTGAQRGFLISERQDDLLIEVSALTTAGAGDTGVPGTAATVMSVCCPPATAGSGGKSSITACRRRFP